MNKLDQLKIKYSEVGHSCGDVEDDVQELLCQLSTALSRESAYREALVNILRTLDPDDCNCDRVDVIARAALDRGPEEPVEREEIVEVVCKSFVRLHGEVDEEASMKAITDTILKDFRVERR